MKKVGYECRNVDKKGGEWEPDRCEGQEKGKTWRRRRGRGQPATKFEKDAGREGGRDGSIMEETFGTFNG